MSSLTLQWFSDDRCESHRSRGAAAAVAIAINVAFVYALFISFRLIRVPESPPVEALHAILIIEPRGQHQESDRRLISFHLSRPTLRLPDEPPNVDIEVPVEQPPPHASDMQAGSHSGRREIPGESASRGFTDKPGNGEGTVALHEVGPAYGEASVKAGERGVVALRVLVDATGRPSQIRVLQSSGFARLDDSAIKAVQQYRFAPQVRGSPAAWTTVRQEFDLLPMPVPTTIIGYDSLIAEQIASAQRADPSILQNDLIKASDVLQRLAINLIAAAARDEPVRPDPQQAHSFPTPIQLLARRGRLRSVRFVGYARRGFDCGTTSVPGSFEDSRCEIFQVQQVGGASYWLAGMKNNGTLLESIAVMVAPEPPR
jgi:TonB family protein